MSLLRRATLAALLLVLPSLGAADKRNLLLVSDIHFDPTADRELVGALIDAPAGEWAAIFSKSASRAFPAYGQDANWALFSSALPAMQASLPKLGAVLVTGDFIA